MRINNITGINIRIFMIAKTINMKARFKSNAVTSQMDKPALSSSQLLSSSPAPTSASICMVKRLSAANLPSRLISSTQEPR